MKNDKVTRLFNEALNRYALIGDGDKILVGLSGGKDSLALLELLAHRQRIFVPRFSVVAVHVKMSNIPYLCDEDYLRSFAEGLGVELMVCETSFDASTDTRHTPCFLCSWQRRKAMFEMAKTLGCNKIALGHHRDDIMQTALMNLTFQGQFSSMRPLMAMDRFPMTIIRPLCLIREKQLEEWALEQGYRRLKRECPYNNATRRNDMKEVVAMLEKLNPEFAYTFYRAIEKNGTPLLNPNNQSQ